jgi:hypothetical protein
VGIGVGVVDCRGPLLLFQVQSFTDEKVAAAKTLLRAHINVNAVDTVY